MENLMPIEGDEIREESSAHRIRKKLRTKRKRFMKRKAVESGTLPRLAPSCDEACKQETNTKPHLRRVFKCVNTYLLAIVGVKYQAISQDPFKTFALNIWSFLIAVCICCLVLFATKQPRTQCNMNLQITLGRVALASGVVSCLSLLSLLIPHFYGLIVLFISWAIFVAISALPLLQRVYNELLTGITTVINIIICFARNFFFGNKISQQQPPPQGTRPRV